MGREVVDELAADADCCELTADRAGDCCGCNGRCIGEEILLVEGATLFPDFRREPTRFLKRAFIDDMKEIRREDVREESDNRIRRKGERRKQR